MGITTVDVLAVAFGLALVVLLLSASKGGRLEERVETLLITLIGTAVGVFGAFRLDAYLQEQQEAHRYHAVLSQVTQQLATRDQLLEVGEEAVFDTAALDSLPETLLPELSMVPTSLRLVGEDPELLDEASPGYLRVVSLLRWAEPDARVPQQYRGSQAYGEYKHRRLSAWTNTALEATRLEIDRVGGALEAEAAEDSILAVLHQYTDSLLTISRDYEGDFSWP